MTKRIRAKHKIDRRLGQNIWGRPKSPLNKREVAPRPARRAPRRQALRLRPAAARQAEAQGLLRQHHRAAVQPHLQGGAPLQGLDLRAPDRAAGAPARRHRLSRQVRADRVRRAPVRQPRPRHGERPARQHPELPLPRRRRGRGEGEGQADDAAARGHQERGARRARLHRGRPQQDDGQAHPRAGASATCPSRCTWSRTWWWSSTAAKLRQTSRRDSMQATIAQSLGGARSPRGANLRQAFTTPARAARRRGELARRACRLTGLGAAPGGSRSWPSRRRAWS